MLHGMHILKVYPKFRTKDAHGTRIARIWRFHSHKNKRSNTWISQNINYTQIFTYPNPNPNTKSKVVPHVVMIMSDGLPLLTASTRIVLHIWVLPHITTENTTIIRSSTITINKSIAHYHSQSRLSSSIYKSHFRLTKCSKHKLSYTIWRWLLRSNFSKYMLFVDVNAASTAFLRSSQMCRSRTTQWK